jgi:copper homeostasis protein
MGFERELEICTESLQACNAAATGGANRIELCSALGEGGVTPSRGLIRAAVEQSSLPVHVLIRPRVGNFVFTKEEFRIMCDDVEDVLALRAAGVVVGALTPRGEVDRDQTATLVRLAHGLPVTFHRAFDHTRDLTEQLEVIINLGCSRVLTSGGMPTVTQGRAMLDKLTKHAAGRIRIAAGGGVTLQAAEHLRNIEGLDFHASVRRRGKPSSMSIADPLWNDASMDGSIRSNDVRDLREMLMFGPRIPLDQHV